MENIRRETDETFYTSSLPTKIGQEMINWLKNKAATNGGLRVRLCTHLSKDDHMPHEMLIVHLRGAYVRPHKHIAKSESFHFIEGFADVVILDGGGKISDVVPMGAYGSEQIFYYRIPENYYHTLVIHSDVLIFHESTRGPHKKEETVYASWAPDGSSNDENIRYMKELGGKAEQFKKVNQYEKTF